MQDMNRRKIGDLRKLFELLKERRPLWDKDDEHFYRAETVNNLWVEVFQEMNKKESEVKSLILQLRGLLRVKKHKRLSKMKAYFRIGSPDWRNVTYLKGVENLQSIPSLNIDEDSDSTCTVNTLTTNIDADTNSDLDSAVGDQAVGDPAVGDPAVGDPAVGSPAVVDDPDVGATNVIDMAFGDMCVSNTAIGGPGVMNPDEVDPVEIDGIVADPADVDKRAKVDPAADNPFQMDPNNDVLANYFWVDCELMDGELPDDNRINFESVNQSADDDWVNMDGTNGERADGEEISPYGLTDDQSTDYEWIDHDSAEHYSSDFSSGFSDCGIGGVCCNRHEFFGHADIDYDVFLTSLRNRLQTLELSARLSAASEILKLLQLYESHRWR